ncbi:hypothetical protein K8R33_03705 [archaeon]|nr:hypothetical protein [archaeon]
MSLNKKGEMLVHFVLVFVVLSFGLSLVLFTQAMENQKGYVGEMQLDLIQLSFDGEKDLIYDKQVLKQGFSDLIVEFGNFGGNFEGDSTDDGYVYFVRGDVDCYPNIGSLESSFISLLNARMDFFGGYETDLIFEKGGMVVDLDSVEEYVVDRDGYEIKHRPMGNINVFYDYDFNSFLENVDELKSVVDLCGADKGCWDNNAKFYFEENNNLFKVEMVSDSITDVFGEKEVVLKAAVDFKELNPLVGDTFQCLV